MAKVLLVEDNEMSRDMLSRRLQRRGYDVLTAVDGQQGITLAKDQIPSIILMDMNLPVIDGWEATKKIKSDEATSEIPVIALTAHAMNGEQQKMFDAGCDACETKPIDFNRLLETMRSLIKGE
jgi:CheY-like chemotaxis protein